MRILGPGRSAIMARRRLVARAAARRSSITSLWPEKSPWEKLSRATFIPASNSFSMTSRECDAGPMVHALLVLLSGRVIDVLLLAGVERLDSCYPRDPSLSFACNGPHLAVILQHLLALTSTALKQ